MRNNTALRVCSEWNISTWEPKNHLLCLKQVQFALHPEYNVHPHILPKKKEHELNDLKNHFINQGHLIGVETKWEVIDNKYLPYISSNTQETILTEEIIGS